MLRQDTPNMSRVDFFLTPITLESGAKVNKGPWALGEIVTNNFKEHRLPIFRDVRAQTQQKIPSSHLGPLRPH